jgi:hypothetical protein
MNVRTIVTCLPPYVTLAVLAEKGKVVPVLIQHNAMETWRVDLEIHVLLTSALVGGEWTTSRPCRIKPREGTPVLTGWVGPATGMDDVE